MRLESMFCRECKETQDVTAVSVYKRTWCFCAACGSATSFKERSFLPLSFLPFEWLTRKKDATEENIYDYFSQPAHQNVSRKNYDLFAKMFSEHLGNLEEKNILDISGGSGHFLKNFQASTRNVLLTEFNQKAVLYARQELGLNAIRYDFNDGDIARSLERGRLGLTFDLVFMNACSMFCKDLTGFIKSLKPILNPGAKIILSGNVKPTLGVAVRTQFDDFTYFVLRSPERLKRSFQDGFECLASFDYEDAYPHYVNGHDVHFLKRTMKNFYLAGGVKKLVKKSNDLKKNSNFRYRDRHVFSQVYTHPK